MIENDLDEISERLRNVTPTDWNVDISTDSRYIYINSEKERPMRNSHVIFFENAATDIAKLAIEVKQLRQINLALKRQIVIQDVDKDLRFM